MPPHFFTIPRDRAEESLGNFPELGMGYQFGVGRERSTSNRQSIETEEINYLIFNGAIAVSQDAYLELVSGNAEYVRDLQGTIEAIDRPDMGKKKFGPAEIPIRIQQARDSYWRFMEAVWALPFLWRHEKRARDERPLHGSPPFHATTRAGDKFLRYSAFRNDYRVGVDGSLKFGTWATSASDGSYVPNALSAVGRYALPNPVAPVHLFEITPPPGTPILHGTVASMHGQAGGGAEIEFQAPLPPGSVVYRGTIPIW